MTGYFALAANDQSYYYLGQLFGSVGSVLQPGGSSSVQLGLLGTMFSTLNSTVMTIGIMVIVYTIVVGLLKTAQEGEFLGKQWSSLWVPFRMVLGIAALVPTGSGYSMIQVFFMWAILQGVGAADTMWNTVLNYVSIFGSPYATVSIPTTVGITQNIATLYQDLVCADAAQRGADGQTFQDRYPDTTSATGDAKYYYCADDYASGVTAPVGAGVVPTVPAADTTYCTQDKLSKILLTPQNYPGVCIFNTDSNGNPAVQCAIGPQPSGGVGACGSLQMNYYSSQMATTCAEAMAQIGQQNNLTQLIQCASYQAEAQAVPVVVGYLELMAAQTNQYDNDYMHFYANTSSPTPTQTPPVWLGRYCTQNNIQPNGCCLYNSIFAVIQEIQDVMLGIAVTAPPQPTCASVDSSLFPLAHNTLPTSQSSQTNQTDYTNMNTSLAKDVIFPCGLEPTAANTSPSGCYTSLVASGNFIQNQINTYTAAINLAVSTTITNYIAASPPSNLSGWFADAQSMGWLLAGSYYYEMAQTNSNNLTMAVPTFLVTATDMTTNSDNVMLNYRNNVKAATSITDSIANAASNSSAMPPGMAQMNAVNSNAGMGISTSFMSSLASGANPLSAMQAEGSSLLSAAQTIYITTTVIMFALTVVSNISFVALGTGTPTSAIGAGILFLVNWLMGLVLAYMAWAFTFGGMLAVYVPLVPYLIYAFAAIGWFTGVIEAIVAAPFVALGIIMPGGQSDMWGRAEPAMMLLLNTCVRPTLMVVGMMAGMLFASVVVSFINAGFLGTMNSVAGTSPSMIEIILFISAYSSLVITALNKCFALIYLLPEKVLTWIGGTAISYGEAESVAQVKGAVEQMAGQFSGAMKGSAEQSTSTAVAAGSSNLATRRKNAQKGKETGGGGTGS